MAYSDFTLRGVVQAFQLTLEEVPDLFAGRPVILAGRFTGASASGQAPVRIRVKGRVGREARPLAKVGKGHKASVRLKVVGPPDTTAQGIATVKAVIGKTVQTIGLRSYSIDTGTTKTIAVTLPAAIRKVLATKGHPKVVLRVLMKIDKKAEHSSWGYSLNMT